MPQPTNGMTLFSDSYQESFGSLIQSENGLVDGAAIEDLGSSGVGARAVDRPTSAVQLKHRARLGGNGIGLAAVPDMTCSASAAE
jgi:hypothetical protein